ncbi:restriction modification system DNA specificitydomain-containing protein [groundwater metagenome]
MREEEIKEVSLKENCCSIQYGYTQSASEEKVGPKFLRITDIQDKIINWQSVPYCKINEEDYKKYKLVDGDILIARTGASTGTNAIYREGMPDAVFASYLIRLKVNSRYIPRFVYYFLQSPIYKEHIESIIGGSAQPNANAQQLTDIPIPLFPLPEQRAIASILGSLDDKIALNRQMNATLEAIGQALFARWFVDFEFPDGEGKPYRSSGGETVETELGEVPRGWRVGTLGEFCDIIMGQSPPGTTYNEIGDGLPFYQGITDFGFRFPSRRVYCTAPTRFAEEGDVLLSVRAPVGSLNVAEERCAIGRGVAALRLKKKQHRYLYYLLCATQSGWNKFEAEGTVFGSVNKADVNDFKVILPSETLRNNFGSLMEPLDKQIMNNEKQSRTLTTIRDALLPKLMSGEIRVDTEVKNETMG